MTANAGPRPRLPAHSISPLQYAVGRSYDELMTPALLLDYAALERNIAKMSKLVRLPTRLRPHAKTHKSPQVAALQLARGALGVTTATLWEARCLAAAGIEDVLIANEIVGGEKATLLARVAANARITVAVDALTNAQELSAAATAEDSQIGVLVDVDVGLGRCGVRNPGDGIALAKEIARLPGLDFRGVMGFEGHCTLEPDRQRREQLARDAMARLLETADAIASTGLPIEVVSAGGTGTYDTTGSNPRVTELQAGSYAFMDTSHAAIVPGFEFALKVLSTVISRHGSTIVIDAGKKAVGLDTPPPVLPDHPSQLQYVAEEHTVLEVDERRAPTVGDRVELVPSYCPVTVNLHDAYFVVQDRIVVDVWPILARGVGWTSTDIGAAFS